MKKIVSLFICILFTFSACKEGSNNRSLSNGYEVKYAKIFTVDKKENFTVVNVINPWDSSRILQSYILVDREKELPADLPHGVLVRIPIQSAVAYSIIHCSSLDEIGSLDIVTGVCESQYISIEEIQKKVREGSIIDVGQASSPDVEKILMLEPEVIFTSPISGQSYGQIEKTKIPIIEAPDYVESDPLGRAEWIRFYSLFVGKELLADSLFDITIHNYNSIKEIVAKATIKPTVLTDTKYQASWNVPGGKSYLANMLSDAGARYIWREDSSTSFLPLPFEEVLDKAGEADYWLIKYYAPEDMTYKGLKKEYTPYSYFNAYKEMHIYGCNTFNKNYYEDLPIHPDYILKDFAYIFHPDLFPDYQPIYYTKINK